MGCNPSAQDAAVLRVALIQIFEMALIQILGVALIRMLGVARVRNFRSRLEYESSGPDQ